MLQAFCFAVVAFTSSQGVSSSPLQNPKVEASLSQDEIVLPVERKDGHFYVKAEVNGRPARFILDTCSSVNVLFPAAAKRLEVKDQVGDAHSSTDSTFLLVKEIKLGGASVKNESAYITEIPGLECDGLIGTPFLQHFSVTFDYDTSKITLRKSGTYKIHGDETTSELLYSSGVTLVPGQIFDQKGWFFLDIGNAGSTKISRWFVAKHDLLKRWPNSNEFVTGIGIDGNLKGRKAISTGYQVAGQSIGEGLVVLDSDDGVSLPETSTLGVLGFQDLQRLRFTLDYPAKKAYFTKSSAYNSHLFKDRSGLKIELSKGKQMVVSVTKNSPGDLAGLKIGDELLEIDGMGSSNTDSRFFTSSFKKPAGTEISVKYSRKGKVAEISFRLKNLAK
jgi:hypothetical protein